MARKVGYGQYCPIARACEVLGERWTMLIVRNMLCGDTRFNDLARGNPRLSRSLLAQRLRQLVRAGIVEQIDGEYLLTPAGEELRPLVFGLGEWGARWNFDDPREDELDPELLMWWAYNRLDFSVLPDRRTVLEFCFRGHPHRYWVVKDSFGPSLCIHDPGFEVDVRITADLAALYKVWLGKIEFRTALRGGLIDLSGPPALTRRLPDVMMLSPVAHQVSATR